MVGESTGLKISDLNLADFKYQTEEVILLPFSGKYRYLFPSDLLAKLHGRLVADETLAQVFAGMNDREDVDKWVPYMDKQPIVLYIEKPGTVTGFGWITESQGIDGARKAAFGFWFVKQAWGTQRVRDLCWLSLRWWFEELNVNILYATSIRANRMAVNFSRIFGFKYLCLLPMFFVQNGKMDDAHLICLKREDFRPKFDLWRESHPAQEKPLEIVLS